tara:strand:- start:228 stop:1055 length:828 start_codon:yes stop_codon:yes gene_type:complete
MTKEDIKIAELLKLDKMFVSIDIETTGLDPVEDRIIQVGVVKCNPDGTVEEGCQLINPEISVPSGAFEVHGITNEELQDKPTWKDIGPQIAHGLKTADICAYNGKFDLKFIAESCKRVGVSFTPGLLIDPCFIFRMKVRHTLTAAIDYYVSQKPLVASLSNSMSSEDANPHDALWDARAALLVLQRQLQEYPDLPRTIPLLHQKLYNTPAPGFLDADRKFKLINGEPHVCFGKFGNPPTPFTRVPVDYFEWMMKTDFSDSTKGIIRQYVSHDFQD